MTVWSIDPETDASDFRADPSVVAIPARIIKQGDDPKVIKEDKPADKPVKVKVIGRFSVAHEGQRYVQGDTVTVPESLADEWLRNHWVEKAVK